MPDTETAASRSARRPWVSFSLWLVIATSVVLRVPEIGEQLVGDHGFRQTQTAITVWHFTEDGIHPFEYQTPVFGPPWRVPMEFPTFQMTAALAVAGLGLEIDQACRLSALFFFYLAALLLYVLCRLLVPDGLFAELTVVFFCWMPFNIYWSVQCMIDFAAVALALGYAVAFVRWMQDPGRLAWFFAALVAGILAYVTKVTTMVAFVPLIGVSILGAIVGGVRSAGSVTDFVRRRSRFLLGIAVLVVTPILYEHTWMIYSDQVKDGSPFTAFLTSGKLVSWNFGSLAQRLDPVNWKIILYRLGFGLPPFFLSVLSVLGFVGLVRQDSRGRLVFLAAAAGVVAPIVVFFNLYLVHNYYLMAVTVPVAMVVGFGGNYVLVRLLGKYPAAVLLVVGLVAFVSAQEIFPPPDQQTIRDYRLAMHLRDVTDPEDRIVVAGRDWNPFILYHARRRGFMMRGGDFGSSPADQREIVRFLEEHGFSVIVTMDEHHWLTTVWRQRNRLPSPPGTSIYRVSGAIPVR